MRGFSKNPLLNVLCSHAAELQKLQDALDLQHQGVLDAQRVDLDQQLRDAKACALEDLEKVKRQYEDELLALKKAAHHDTSAAEQQHVEALAARERAHAHEMSELRKDHAGALERLESESLTAAKEASQHLLKEKQSAAADIKKLQVNSLTTPRCNLAFHWISEMIPTQ